MTPRQRGYRDTTEASGKRRRGVSFSRENLSLAEGVASSPAADMGKWPRLGLLLVITVSHLRASQSRPCPANAELGRVSLHASSDECLCVEGYQFVNFTYLDIDADGGLSFGEYRDALRAVDFVRCAFTSDLNVKKVKH